MVLRNHTLATRGLFGKAKSHGDASGRGGVSGDAFSLVEVILAVGLIAFVLTAILGLVTLAVQGTRKADLDARLSVLTSRLSASYQNRDFTNALSELSTNATTYYDLYGTPTNAAAAYFRCDVANATPATNSPNLAVLRFQIRWPVPQLAFTNIYVASIGNFQ